MDVLDTALSSITFLTRSEKIILRKNIDSLSALAVLSINDIARLVGREIHNAVWNPRQTAAFATKAFAVMQSQGINGIGFSESGYPALLRELLDAPYMIFYRGNLKVLEKACVSVVGTRRICREAAEATFNFAKEAALNGCAVVSGMASGVDAFAHKGALASGVEASTVAVLPCGIDTVIPVAHKALARHILEKGGLLLSEYIPGCPSEAWRFVQRNRIIAALSPATVLTQAPAGSGALITADFAVECNREVMILDSCFCAEAKAQNEEAVKNLKMRLEKGRNKTGLVHKLEFTTESLIRDGAPVIENYTDYVAVRRDAPGTHVVKEEV